MKCEIMLKSGAKLGFSLKKTKPSTRKLVKFVNSVNSWYSTRSNANFNFS